MTIERHTITLDFYSLDDLRSILDHRRRLTLAPEVEEAIRRGAEFVQRKAREDRHVYGVNTGFGSLCEERIRPDEVELLQYNHVVSHACGVGPIVEERLCRLAILIKLLTFRSGHTGITLRTVQRILDHWNHDIIPATPQKGTVGASGDLAPLAHLALPLLGMGKVYRDGQLVDAAPVLEEMGWKPLRLEAKEGLALTNGVQYIQAVAADCLMTIQELLPAADVVASLSVQAFAGSWTFYQPQYHATAHHEERRTVAANLRWLLEGSNHSELPTCNRSGQDPYSFRCLPQVHGAVRQAVGYSSRVIEQELNSVSDNPLFFPDDDLVLFGGNLHGESTAITLDLLAIAVTELTSISERRAYQLLSGQRGLVDFLVKKPGVNSGFMIVQYTAAALLNENKVLSTPASVDTIPTSQLQEDHVSMGGTSAHKLRTVVENCEWVLAIEMLIAAQAVELQAGLRLSPFTQRIHDDLREVVPSLEEDRVMAPDMGTSLELLRRWRRRWHREESLR
jgi:histidine ammonia-lyase